MKNKNAKAAIKLRGCEVSWLRGYLTNLETPQPRNPATLMYNPQNIFAKILRGEIPCKKIFENDYALAFYDINPAAPIHALVIPKNAYISHVDFAATASDAEITGFTRAVGTVANMLGVDETGYRIIANHGANAHQEVPHYHVHILGGRALGPLLVS
jgi:histidine triad (HIT) family protein